MKSIQWISVGVLWGATGLLSWAVWVQDLLNVWQGTLALGFIWYAIQSVLDVRTRIQWQLRLVTTTALVLSVLWQNGSWTVVLSNALEPKSVGPDPVIWSVGLLGLGALLLLWLQYSEKRNGSGLVFVRHSILLLSCSLIVEVLRYNNIDVSNYWTNTLISWVFIVASVDWIWTAYKFQKWTPEQRWTSPVLVLVSSRLNPIQSMFDALERLFGIDIQGTWVIRFVRQMLEPLVVCLLLFGWLSTSMVQIQPDERGVRSHFGTPESDVLDGGLHWKLPYPFGRVDRVAASRIHQMSIGHEESEVLDTEEEGPESILWANQHGDEEFLLLLGDGHDVMSADGVLEYRISDVHQYLFGVQNPEEVLESIVYQVLMEQTSSRTLEEALSENLIVLAQLVTTEIQDRIGQYEIGIEPLLFTFTALHPPVSVAKDYQDVVSAQIDQQTKVLRAEQYQLSTLPRTRAKSIRSIEDAKQESVLGLASATGEAVSFEALRQTVRSQESLYRFRRRQENLQQSIKGRDIVILDHRLESQGATLWINP